MSPFYSNLAPLSVQPRFNGELPKIEMPRRLWVYAVGFSIIILSKIVIPLVLYAVTRVWNLPEQLIGYCLAKGPTFVIGVGFILFSLDHLLWPKRSLVSWVVPSQEEGTQGSERIQSERMTPRKRARILGDAQIVGVVTLGVGILWLYVTFFSKASAGYSANAWPPLPYPTPIR
jgi:hypothetical protein